MRKIRIFCFAITMAFVSVSVAFSDGQFDTTVLEIQVNGKPAPLNKEDLSGLTTKPLRSLIERNNEKAGDANFMQAFYVDVRVGDQVAGKYHLSEKGVRGTAYKLLREQDDTPRYFTMPVTKYHGEQETATYEEQIEPFVEECFIIIFEKTEDINKKNTHITYFENRVKQLELTD